VADGRSDDAQIATHLDAQDRALWRERRAAMAAGSGLAARGVSFVVILVTVPVTLAYLGTAPFGFAATLTALAGLLAFADLGISKGLLNTVASAHGRDDRAEISKAVGSAFYTMAALAGLLGVIAVVFVPAVDWAILLGAEGAVSRGDAAAAMLALVLVTLAGMPLSCVTASRYGLQQGYKENLFQIGGAVASLFLVLATVAMNAGLPMVVLASAAGPLLVGLVDGAALIHGLPWFRPRPISWDKTSAIRLLRIGLGFLSLQVALTLGFTTDTIVLARLLGPTSVAQYSVALRLFTIPALLVSVSLSPLWPAYREAAHSGDMDWVRTTFRRSRLVALAVAGPTSLVLAVSVGLIADLWTGGRLTIEPALGAGLAASTIAVALWNTYAYLFNGLQELRFTVPATWLMAAVNLPLSIVLTAIVGVSGVAWGSAIAVTLCLLIPSTRYLASALRRHDLTSVRNGTGQAAQGLPVLGRIPRR
jgi:O-antigen/teichoic acid export membrane protein